MSGNDNLSRSKTMIKCEVDQNRMGHLTVTFPDGRNLYIQGEADIIAFVSNCGGNIEDPEDIIECFDDYYDVSELPEN
jgi:hypothetical protein